MLEIRPKIDLAKIEKFEQGSPPASPPNLDHCLPLSLKAPNSSFGYIKDAGRQELPKETSQGGNLSSTDA